MRWILPLAVCLIVLCGLARSAWAQAYGAADRVLPGDQPIQEYLARLSHENFEQFAGDLKSLDEWKSRRQTYLNEYLYMLGLHPLPERTPLKATVTGTLTRDGYAVDMIHYQSRPGLYVTGNLYRPADVKPGAKLPAVLYVCGHSNEGRNGNKTAYQAHGIWFAKHGYICLTVDTLQLGEIAAIHHGTYRENRWWWHSRGYTSAGVECWNGVRGIDYLVSRDDVDSQRIAVTGISGGGAATFWIAAADDRVKVAVPVSGMADLPSYVANRVINGHCDCMFLYNTFDWPWVRIAGLIAPRPMLFANSDQDAIFPMDANERVIAQLERLYSLHGASDQVDAMVSVGGHAYRKDLRQAIFRFINIHLKGDAREVTDSELDLVPDKGNKSTYPIEPEKLRVFPTDSDLPADQLNTTIDEHFVPAASVTVPAAGDYSKWRDALKGELRRVVFRSLPEAIPAAMLSKPESLLTEPGITIKLQQLNGTMVGSPKRVTLIVGDAEQDWLNDRLASRMKQDSECYACLPRGIGESRWTRKNPPNYVERSHVLLGRTVETGRVHDVIATLNYLKTQYPSVPLRVAGSGNAAVLAAYAALWNPHVSEIVLENPPWTHMDSAAPQFLNILRVADVPDMLGLLAPRQLEITTSDERVGKVKKYYEAEGHADRLTVVPRK